MLIDGKGWITARPLENYSSLQLGILLLRKGMGMEECLDKNSLFH